MPSHKAKPKKTPINTINSGKTFLDTNSYRKKLHNYEGKIITEIYYLLANNYDYNFQTLHSVDLAVLIKFENDLWLNWTWKEEDIEVNFSKITPQGYYLNYASLEELESSDLRIINMSRNKQWTSFIGSKIKQIQLYTLKDENVKYHIDLILKTNNNKTVTFCATDELTSSDFKEIETSYVPISNNWSAIIFDDQILKFNKRGVYSK